MPLHLRYLPYLAALVATAGLAWALHSNPAYMPLLAPLLAVTAFLAVLGTYDIIQPQHSILRNYPIMAHMRFLLETIRPELRQYFFEDEKSGTPFPRDKRSVAYQRAKMQLDTRPFGTQYNVYEPTFEWIQHSIAASDPSPGTFRLTIGGPACQHPYRASVLNISAMSFGSMSANAILALNQGAKLGGFAHDTGEGGLSSYHRVHGGDVIWELGSGYFGARNRDGSFSPERFREVAADDQIKMIEIKLSQGAKPGHGGVLPAAKVTPEIAAIRGVEVGVDCISPPRHSAFSTPIELLHFVARLRDLSGGKPVGFKLCVGHPWEFLAIVKAMLETGIRPDFIVIDGKEGGTGAAPLEFMDHVGMPLRDGLSFAHNAMVGAGVREGIRLGASGKIVTAFDIARTMAIGADWCNSARGFMFALGCIQAQNCHTDKCPTGVTTQDPLRQRALVVPEKAVRVSQFHEATLKALAELIAAAGLAHPSDLRPYHIFHRGTATAASSYEELYPSLRPGELIAGTDDKRFAEAWHLARADSFQRAV